MPEPFIILFSVSIVFLYWAVYHAYNAPNSKKPLGITRKILSIATLLIGYGFTVAIVFELSCPENLTFLGSMVILPFSTLIFTLGVFLYRLSFKWVMILLGSIEIALASGYLFYTFLFNVPHGLNPLNYMYTVPYRRIIILLYGVLFLLPVFASIIHRIHNLTIMNKRLF